MARIPGDMKELLREAPSNWGRFGPGDEIGSLNYLDASEVLRAVRSVQSGRTFTLMLQVGNPKGDPVFPGYAPAAHFMTQDKGSYEAGRLKAVGGGVEYAADVLQVAQHGTTHCDALGHTWFDDTLYGGFPAASTKGGLAHAGILPIAEHGIVGHAVLLDVARLMGKPYLPMHTHVHLADLLDAAKAQKVEIRKHDLLMIRTGILNLFYEQGPEAFYKEFDEPGLTYEREIVDFFHDMEIPVSGTDILSGELLNSQTVEAVFPMHAALSRNLGVVFIEAHWFEDWASDCAGDGKYDGLYMASPWKIVGGTASPVNPILVK